MRIIYSQAKTKKELLHLTMNYEICRCSRQSETKSIHGYGINYCSNYEGKLKILKSDIIAYGVIDIRNKLLISYFCHVDKQHSKNEYIYLFFSGF